MTLQMRLRLLLALCLGLCLFFVFNPQVDLITSSWFFDGHDFDWKFEPFPVFMHDLVHPVSLLLASLFSATALWRYRQGRSMRPALFLLLSLIVGPGLVTNTLLKDNWDRARPQQIVEFGGDKQFSPPLVMSNQCVDNCSFISGDAAFGFWFHSFAYVALFAVRRRRQIFWAGLGVGVFYGVLRISMGAHFLSDVYFAGVFMAMSSALVAALVLGRESVTTLWHEVLGGRCPAEQLANQRH